MNSSARAMTRIRDEYPYPYGSIIKEYMQWNMLENNESDGVDKIIAYSNHRWQGVEDIRQGYPRIYICMDGTLARRICQEQSYRQPGRPERLAIAKRPFRERHTMKTILTLLLLEAIATLLFRKE